MYNMCKSDSENETIKIKKAHVSRLRKVGKIELLGCIDLFSPLIIHSVTEQLTWEPFQLGFEEIQNYL